MARSVAIVGRPNVGKSTLFNRLVGKRLALVDDTPGVTRDRREGSAKLGDLQFQVIDTAGLEDRNDDSLEARMREQTVRAVAGADVALLVIDARLGITPADRHFAASLRRGPTPVLLVANKCESRSSQPGLFEAFELGLGEPVPISAEHGEGLADLYAALEPHLRDPENDPKTDNEAGLEPEVQRDRPLQFAIVGRPNVGKSTLINRLIGEDRLLTGPEAGITRDSIAVAAMYHGRAVKLVDTAGIRRHAQVHEKLEKLAVADSLRSIRYAEIVALVVDATIGLEKQDLTIAAQVVEEGRALMIVANKWDAVTNRDATLQAIRDRLEFSLPQVRGMPVVTLSAVTGQNVDALFKSAVALDKIWNTRLPTAEVNRWLARVTEAHPPPLVAGRRLKIRYATQVKARPPTFALFVSKPEELPESYLRYLINTLRDDFKLDGVPVRLLTRKGKNPYAEQG